MSPHTPTGSCTMREIALVVPVSTTRPPLPARPAKYRKHFATSVTSYSLSTSRFPVSSDSARAIAAEFSSSAAATRRRSAARSVKGVARQSPASKARRAAPIAAIVSASPASSTTATSDWSAGQRTSRVSPATALTHAPSMNKVAMAGLSSLSVVSCVDACRDTGRTVRAPARGARCP